MAGPSRALSEKIDNPCYDSETKTDCPRRCGGCQVDCPEWKEYEAKRAELYRQRAVQYRANSIIKDIKYERHDKFLKKKQRLKRIYR